MGSIGMSEATIQVSLKYTLTFESAFHCGSGLPRLLIDRGIHRDSEGNLFVPGATIKGVLRDRCEQVASLFGLSVRSPHDKNAALSEYNAPDLPSRLFGSRLRPGKLYFDDLRLSEEDFEFFKRSNNPWLQITERTQVSISRYTGTAKPAMLFTSEFGVEDVCFHGRILGHVQDLSLPLEDGLTPGGPSCGVLLLVIGLLSIDRIGGNKSTGLGKCRINIESLEVSGKACNLADWLEKIDNLHYVEMS